MAKYFDKDGKEVEAFSQEELEAQKKDALAVYLKENPNQSEAFKKAQKDLDDANKKLKDLEDSGNDGQKKRLKEERDAAESKLKEFTESMGKEIKSLKEGFFGSAKKKVLDKLVGDDAQLRAKVELEYDAFKGEPSNDVEIQERLTKAFTLATGNKPKPNFMDGMTQAPRGGDFNKAGATLESDNAKAIRKVVGLSDDVAKKYEGKSAINP